VKRYLYIETGDDGCGDLYVSLKPLDGAEYREVSLSDIEKSCFMGRNEDAKIKICISQNESVMTDINYKKLLLMALLAHYNAEGQCWKGDWKGKQYGIDELSKEEKEALQEVLGEVKNLVGDY
jgi:hypothetical protein